LKPGPAGLFFFKRLIKLTYIKHKIGLIELYQNLKNMNENLAKYIASALRNGANEQLPSNSWEEGSSSHDWSTDTFKPQFLVDGKFSLRLDEVV
jgi:hypothetical protein